MSELVSKVFTNLADNPYFGAGFGLVGVGASLAAARQAFFVGVIVFKRHFMMTLELTHRDQAYQWVLKWLTHHHKSAQHLSVVTQVYREQSGHFATQFSYMPSVGSHFLQFKNKWMKIERERQQTVTEPFETIKFTCFGNDRQIFNDILSHATELELSSHEGKTVIYEAKSHSWEPIGEPRTRREFESVILDSDIAETILADVNEFQESREWYSKRGVPYRRGYLLYGPPGCGKTSYITALAGKLNYDICQMNLSDLSLADDRLGHFLNVAPPNSIILLEDIDAAFYDREDLDSTKIAYQGLRKLTLSGILNTIDGVASSEERMLFMTTNYPERLDKALTRPGRVDRKFYIGYASDDQLLRAFDRFYPINDAGSGPTGKSFVRAVNSVRRKLKLPKGKLELSMADVQSYFLLHKDKPKDAIKHFDDWLIDKFSPKSQIEDKSMPSTGDNDPDLVISDLNSL